MITRGDGPTGARNFALSSDGPVFGDLTGTRAAERTVICFGGKVFVDDGRCTSWNDLPDGEWSRGDEPCRIEALADGATLHSGDMSLTLSARGTALYGMGAAPAQRRFATIVEARRAAAAQAAATQARFSRATTAAALVAAAASTPHVIDRGLVVKVRGYVRAEWPDQHRIVVADTKAEREDEPSVECQYDGAPPKLSAGDRAAASGTLDGITSVVGRQGLEAVELDECTIAPTK